MLFKKSETSAALRKFWFVCVDDTDGKTAETGLTFSGAELQVAKAGGAFANMTNSGTVVERSDGAYEAEFTETELNTSGDILFKVEKTGVRTTIMVPGTVVGFDPHVALATDAALTTVDDFLDTEIAAIKAKTDNLPSDPADASDIAAALATIQADTDDIQTRLPAALVGGRMDSSVGAMAADVVTAASIAAGAIDYATLATDLLGPLGIVRRDTATAGAASTITLDASASAVDSFYKHTKILIASGTGAGQVRGYSSYVGSTKVYTVDSAWSTNPDATSVFVLIAEPSATLGAGSINLASFASDALLGAFGILHSGTAQTGGALTVTLASGASATNGTYENGTVMIGGGTGAGQLNTITGYVGSTKVATVAEAWATVPDATSTYVVFQNGTARAVSSDILEGLAVEGSNTLGDLMRLVVGVLAGTVLDFTTGTLVYKSLDGTKTRLTGTKDATGRLTVTLGDLT